MHDEKPVMLWLYFLGMPKSTVLFAIIKLTVIFSALWKWGMS